MMDYGRKVVITAGCSGIGAELTKHMLRCGYIVIPTTRILEHGQVFVDTLEKKFKDLCFPMQLSLDEQNKIDDFVGQLTKKYEKIDALVNCAVCRENITNCYEMDIEKWDRHYRINVFGTAYLSAQVAEKIIKQDGAIVNISSFYSINVPDNRVYDEHTIPTSLIYASSKASLNYITQYMAVRYSERNINVNAILAGGVENELRQSKFFVENYCYRTPMKRMAHIDEFNKAVEFFVSGSNRYCTGQLLSIDGGWGLL
jgi:Dehydrogenases with different specificities (related to short-chain alcohol dehydrogenases)